ncbi:MAG: aminomethyltransferase beta-barrel domain-containing protein [Patescibacteria group bacterium]
MEKNRETWVVKFEVPQASLTSGQSLVVYDNEICLGGGVIV